MPTNAKILLICLDSSEPDLLKAWSDAGDMPVLKSLRDGGFWGDIRNLPGFGNAVFWPSFFTGTNPGRHGFYFLLQLQKGTYRLHRFCEETKLGVEPFWSALGRNGKRVAVVDMVGAPLTPGLNGIQVADWIGHRRVAEPRSWPAELMPEVMARYGDDPLQARAEYGGRKPEDFVDLHRKMLERVEAKTRMSCEYLEAGGWDLFATTFGEPHDVGHICWHLHDPAHPLHDPELVRNLGDPLKELHVALDGAIGRLMAAAGPEATVVVFAGPGMEAGYSANEVMDNILMRIDATSGRQGRSTIAKLKGFYRGIAPTSLKKRVQKISSKTGVNLDLGERRSRKSFAVPHNNNSGAIRVNLIGREPHGLIAPGAEYDAYCDALSRDLLDIVNLDSGEPLISEVVRPRDFCHGDRVDDLPDLLAIWHRSHPIVRIGSPKIGEIKVPTGGRRSGDHTAHGSVLACGPGIAAGEMDESVSLMAVAPTIAALLGVTLPDADGEPIPEISAVNA